MKRSNGGFSLVELAVVVAVVGLLIILAVRFVPQTLTDAGRSLGQDDLEAVGEAVTGFALANSRLPCPDSDGDGLENCTTSLGQLPYRTLGQSSPVRNALGHDYRYAIYRNAGADSDLAVVSNRFEPLLPVAAALGTRNGLDLCEALRTAALAPAPTQLRVAPAGVNVAFVVADPGAVDADADGSVFDGFNVGANSLFGTPEGAMGADYDDRVLAVGFNRLAMRLGCPAAVATVNGLARAAVAAEDQRLLADLYQQFRAFALEVARANEEIAESKFYLATASVAIALAGEAVAIALATESLGAAALQIALSAVALADAGYALADAIMAWDEAKAAITTATAQLNAANEALMSATRFATERLSAAQAAERRGLFQ